MARAPLDPQVPSTGQKYQALLAVSEAIVSHRDLSGLFHELAGRLHQVVRFDYLGLSLHEPTSNTLRPYVLEGTAGDGRARPERAVAGDVPADV